MKNNIYSQMMHMEKEAWGPVSKWNPTSWGKNFDLRRQQYLQQGTQTGLEKARQKEINVITQSLERFNKQLKQYDEQYKKLKLNFNSAIEKARQLGVDPKVVFPDAFNKVKDIDQVIEKMLQPKATTAALTKRIVVAQTENIVKTVTDISTSLNQLLVNLKNFFNQSAVNFGKLDMTRINDTGTQSKFNKVKQLLEQAGFPIQNETKPTETIEKPTGTETLAPSTEATPPVTAPAASGAAGAAGAGAGAKEYLDNYPDDLKTSFANLFGKNLAINNLIFNKMKTDPGAFVSQLMNLANMVATATPKAAATPTPAGTATAPAVMPATASLRYNMYRKAPKSW